LENGFRIGELHHVEPSVNSVIGPAGTTRLEPKVMHVLVCLAKHAGHVVAKEDLIRTVWPDTFVTDDVLTRAISELRRVLGDDAKDSRIIQTIPKSGYRLIAGVDFGGSPRVVATPAQTGDVPTIPVSNHRTPAHEATWPSGLNWGIWATGLAVAVLVGFLIWGARGSGRQELPETAPLPLQTAPLTSLPGREKAPTFSPDGDQVAFVWDGEAGNDDIYIQVVGVGTPLRLTTNPAADRKPAWSPDGRYIAFIRVSASESAIVVIPALGGSERKIATVSWSEYWDLFGAALSWSPDGKFLAYSDRPSQGRQAGVFVLSTDGSVKRKLTDPSSGSAEEVAPAISPDGRTVAFIRVASGGVADIYLVPFGGGEPRRLALDEDWLQRASAGGHRTRRSLVWVSNGRDLVFSSGGALSGGTLWRVSASGGKPERLPIGGDNATYPAVSSRASRLAYVHESMDANIWRIEIRDPARSVSPPTKLIASTRHEAGPQFSPDGKRIAFHSNRSGSVEIWVCDADGRHPLQLTSLGSHSGTPRWSPDSRIIAFDSRASERADIYVIDAEGGVPRRLTTEPSDDVVPSWSSDGRWIYFASDRTGRWEVWKLSPEGGRAVQVTKHGGFVSFGSHDGQSVFYAHGFNTKAIWRVSVNGGEEAPMLEIPGMGYWGYWAVGKGGIYYVTRRPHALEYFDFATRRAARVATLTIPPVGFEPGLALSPNERFFTLSRTRSAVTSFWWRIFDKARVGQCAAS
jgi:Tol biopolymer transport system component/DNA-binding winged helix-turn-helix (wHTH) protein